jgi:peroxiredoxin
MAAPTGRPTRRQVLGWTAGALAAASPRLIAMTQQTPLDQLPPNLPVPQDDGGCRHLTGMRLPDLALPSTRSRPVNLARITAPRLVLYAYPMTGRPGVTLPQGWDDIPGARGCTLETCGFRDHHADLARLQTEVLGVSTQTTEYQQEMVDRLKVPFEVLSDADFRLVEALRLPTFTAGGMRLIKRLTIVASAGRIEHVFYPVFPPDKHAEEVIAWLKAHPRA